MGLCVRLRSLLHGLRRYFVFPCQAEGCLGGVVRYGYEIERNFLLTCMRAILSKLECSGDVMTEVILFLA